MENLTFIAIAIAITTNIIAIATLIYARSSQPVGPEGDNEPVVKGKKLTLTIRDESGNIIIERLIPVNEK